MIGQTEKIAPADRSLYALRDVTGTVESPYLICASIMSKKLAEGTDALVLDVKTGSGAFMKKEEDAVFLAELMVETGERMGKRMVALITDMNQPLGRMVGNALEVRESIEVLHGGGPEDLRQLCLELAAWMFFLGGVSKTVAHGKQLSAQIIASGQAFERFRQMVEMQGGDISTIDDPTRLPGTEHRVELPSRRARICDFDPVRTGRHRLRHPRRRPRTQRRFRRSFCRCRGSQKSPATKFPLASRSAPFTAIPTSRPRAQRRCCKRVIKSPTPRPRTNRPWFIARFIKGNTDSSRG